MNILVWLAACNVTLEIGTHIVVHRHQGVRCYDEWEQINTVTTQWARWRLKPPAYSTVCWGVDQRKHQSPASLDFVSAIHWWLVNSPHKGPVTRKMFPFDDVIMAEILILTPHNPCQITINHIKIAYQTRYIHCQDNGPHATHKRFAEDVQHDMK